MRLREISPADPVSQIALDGLIETAPILLDAEFYTREGNADNIKDAPSGATQTKITRSLNEPNTPIAGARTYSPATKKIVSFDSKVDVILEDRNEDVEAELIKQTLIDAKEAGWVLQDLFFNGDVGEDSENFDGMVNLVHADWIKTIEANGIYVPVGSSDTNASLQQLAVEKLLQGFAMVRGGTQIAYMNEYLKIRWLTVAKALGYYRQSKDELGNTIDMIGNVIIKGASYSKAGTPLLPFTETCGTSTNTSSIYCVRWGERTNLTCLTSVGLKGRYAGQVGNQIINNVNLDMTMHLQDITSLVQLKGFQIESPS